MVFKIQRTFRLLGFVLDSFENGKSLTGQDNNFGCMNQTDSHLLL